MSKTKFILEKGNVDSNNQQVIVDGIIFKDEYPIYKDFEKCKCIGTCTVSVENGMLIAESELSTEHEGLYPSIGFLTIQSYEKNDVTVHTKSKLICVGLCEVQNIDPTIEPIKLKPNQKKMESEKNTISFKFENEPTPILELCPNGDIFVKGELIENDIEVVEGLREFLKNALD